MVGRQTPLLALFVPLILVGMVDGTRGIRQAWPAAVVGGLAFAVGQFVCSNYVSVELTDIVASLLSAGAIVALLQVWSPREPLRGEPRPAARSPRSPAPRSPTPPTRPRCGARRATATTRRAEVFRAFAPVPAHHRRVRARPVRADQGLPRRAARTRSTGPGSTSSTPRARRRRRVTFKFNWANAAGTLLLVAGLLTMIVLRVSPGRALRVFGARCTS